MSRIHPNNWKTALAADCSNVATTITLTDNLPTISAGEWVIITVTDNVNYELFKIDSNAGAPIYTITARALEDTSAQNWVTGDQVSIRITKGSVDDKQDLLSGLSITTATVATDDKVLIQDTSDSNNIKTITTQAIADLAPVYDPSNTSGTECTRVGSGAGNAILSGGDRNTFVGYNCGNLVTTADDNTAIGWKALDAATTGNTLAATAVGSDALGSVTSGIANTGIGYQAGLGIDTSNHNTVIGYSALQGTNANNTVAIGSNCLNGTLSTVSQQVVVGYQAGSRGTNNVHLGYQAGGGTNTSARDQQVGIGYQALYGRTGTNNVAAGYQAGYISGGSATAGANNTFLGAATGSTSTTGDNNTCLGYQADKSSATVSNEFTLGNSSITTLRCQQTSITALSDRRDKMQIEDIPLGLDFINSLRPVKFTWNMRDGSKVGVKEGGFIAQDLLATQHKYNADWLEIVLQTNPDKLEATPGKLIPILVKAIQELSTKLYNLEKKNA